RASSSRGRSSSKTTPGVVFRSRLEKTTPGVFMFSTDDTIVAVATPPGRGGIGVVRLSGSDAPRIAQTLVARSAPFEPRHATFARVVDDSPASVVDQVVVTWFSQPHSYTGEDVVEISGHGSP